jgi:hypothetical protein
MMDDNQIAELFVDIYDNHWGADTKFNDYVLPEESELTAYIKVCCAIGLRAYANREVDVAKFTQGLIDAIDEVVPNISAQGFLKKTWIDLCNAHGKNPEQEFSSFSDFVAWKRPQIETIGQLIECATGLDLGTCFGAAKYADYSPGVIEEVAERFYADFVNTESQLIRFAFYGALYSMQPSDPRVSKLNEKFKAEEVDPFLGFILDRIDEKGIQQNLIGENEISRLKRPEDRAISSVDEISGRAIADFDPRSPSFETIDEYGVDSILSDDFQELESLTDFEFLDYIAFVWDLDYPLALYLAVANPFVTFDFEITDHEDRTFHGEWEYYSHSSDGICAALPGDFYDIFETIPRLRTFYSLQHIIERTEDEISNINWDPYASILFTRSDLASQQRSKYILDELSKPESIAKIDTWEVWGGGGYFVDVEIACLFETNDEVHQKIFDADSEALKLALLLNPSISKTLRHQIEESGLQLEFPEDFDALSDLIEEAETYKDPGLAKILLALDRDED